MKVARSDYLLNGKTTSCGCSRKSTRADLTNKRFGRLVAQSSVWKDGSTYWSCQCDCGNKKDVRADSLTSGKTQSCGCLNLENAIEKLVKGRYERRIEGIDVQQLRQKLSSRNKSGRTGVFYDKYKKTWFAIIGLNNKQIAIRCDDKKEAIRVREELEELYHQPLIEKMEDKNE